MNPLSLAKADAGPSLSIRSSAASSLRIESRDLHPGARLPSIRGFAKSHELSRFTVVEAYDRLVAMGYLQARRGAGFFATVPATRQGR